MDSKKILIVEDELITAQRIRTVLEESGYSVSAIAISCNEALASIEKVIPDLILMDIHLQGGIDGITTVRSINKHHVLPVIYLTNLDDNTVFRHAKDTFPENYIVKPFTNNSLLRAIELAFQKEYRNRTTSSLNTALIASDSIFILTNNNLHERIFFKDILYIQASGSYTNIYVQKDKATNTTCFNISTSSNHVVGQMMQHSIVRVHRSYYVNASKIDLVSESSIFIQDIEIPIGRKYRNSLFERLTFLKQI